MLRQAAGHRERRTGRGAAPPCADRRAQGRGGGGGGGGGAAARGARGAARGQAATHASLPTARHAPRRRCGPSRTSGSTAGETQTTASTRAGTTDRCTGARTETLQGPSSSPALARPDSCTRPACWARRVCGRPPTLIGPVRPLCTHVCCFTARKTTRFPERGCLLLHTGNSRDISTTP